MTADRGNQDPETDLNVEPAKFPFRRPGYREYSLHVLSSLLDCQRLTASAIMNPAFGICELAASPTLRESSSAVAQHREDSAWVCQGKSWSWHASLAPGMNVLGVFGGYEKITLI